MAHKFYKASFVNLLQLDRPRLSAGHSRYGHSGTRRLDVLILVRKVGTEREGHHLTGPLDFLTPAFKGWLWHEKWNRAGTVRSQHICGTSGLRGLSSDSTLPREAGSGVGLSLGGWWVT